VQVDGAVPVEQDIPPAQPGDLGDAGTGVVEVASITASRCPLQVLRSGQDGGDLIPGQVAQDRLVEALGRDREHREYRPASCSWVGGPSGSITNKPPRACCHPSVASPIMPRTG
jgi:hypothetical protein